MAALLRAFHPGEPAGHDRSPPALGRREVKQFAGSEHVDGPMQKDGTLALNEGERQKNRFFAGLYFILIQLEFIPPSSILKRYSNCKGLPSWRLF